MDKCVYFRYADVEDVHLEKPQSVPVNEDKEKLLAVQVEAKEQTETTPVEVITPNASLKSDATSVEVMTDNATVKASPKHDKSNSVEITISNDTK